MCYKAVCSRTGKELFLFRNNKPFKDWGPFRNIPSDKWPGGGGRTKGAGGFWCTTGGMVRFG